MLSGWKYVKKRKYMIGAFMKQITEEILEGGNFYHYQTVGYLHVEFSR